MSISMTWLPGFTSRVSGVERSPLYLGGIPFGSSGTGSGGRSASFFPSASHFFIRSAPLLISAHFSASCCFASRLSVLPTKTTWTVPTGARSRTYWPSSIGAVANAPPSVNTVIWPWRTGLPRQRTCPVTRANSVAGLLEQPAASTSTNTPPPRTAEVTTWRCLSIVIHLEREGGSAGDGWLVGDRPHSED